MLPIVQYLIYLLVFYSAFFRQHFRALMMPLYKLVYHILRIIYVHMYKMHVYCANS